MPKPAQRFAELLLCARCLRTWSHSPPQQPCELALTTPISQIGNLKQEEKGFAPVYNHL